VVRSLRIEKGVSPTASIPPQENKTSVGGNAVRKKGRKRKKKIACRTLAEGRKLNNIEDRHVSGCFARNLDERKVLDREEITPRGGVTRNEILGRWDDAFIL